MCSFKCQLQSLTGILTVIYFAIKLLWLGSQYFIIRIQTLFLPCLFLIKYYLKMYKLVKWLNFCTFLITTVFIPSIEYRLQFWSHMSLYWFFFFFSFKNPLMVWKRPVDFQWEMYLASWFLLMYSDKLCSCLFNQEFVNITLTNVSF